MKFIALVLFAASLAATRCAAAEWPPCSMFEGNVACVRTATLTEAWLAQVRQFQTTNRSAGLILDLRFADGEAATLDAAVKLFSAKKIPLMILVNGQTRGAAAELASRLRVAKAGVVIGSGNAAAGLAPDIAVAVGADEEKIYFANPFAVTMTNNPAALSAKNDLRAFVDHMTEAELVRRKIKDGEDESDDTTTPRPGPAQPVVRDPVLVRALDLLKALAVLKK